MLKEPYYNHDGITLYCGDCLDILQHIERIDHVITDPPYARDVYVRMSRLVKTGRVSDGHDFNIRNGDACSKLAAGDIGTIDEMRVPLSAFFARIVSRWVIVWTDIESCHEWRMSLTDAGLSYVRTGIWAKTNPVPQFSGDRPGTGVEACIIAHAKGKTRWNGGGHAALWHYQSVVNGSAERVAHPCPKPLALMKQLIAQFTDTGDLILDPMCGSGTTLRACKDLSRRCIGIEIKEEYCKIAVKRLAQEVLFSKQVALPDVTG